MAILFTPQERAGDKIAGERFQNNALALCHRRPEGLLNLKVSDLHFVIHIHCPRDGLDQAHTPVLILYEVVDLLLLTLPGNLAVQIRPVEARASNQATFLDQFGQDGDRHLQ